MDGRPLASRDVVRNAVSIDLDPVPGLAGKPEVTLELSGYQRGQLVVRRREKVALG